jgi:uncharacterized repeat protein (TIGR02543 family)
MTHSSSRSTRYLSILFNTFLIVSMLFPTTGNVAAQGNIATETPPPPENSPTCYTLTVSVEGSGSIPTTTPIQSDGCADTGQYVEGESITLSGAAPDEGWQIGGWAGTTDDASTADANTVLMPADDHSVSVTYTEIPAAPVITDTETPPAEVTPTDAATEKPAQFVLKVDIAGNGKVVLGPDGGSYDPGTVVTITAVPDDGWQFSGWTGEVSNYKNPTTIRMDKDQTVKATFIEAPLIQSLLSDEQDTNDNVTAMDSGGVTYIGDIGSITANAAGTSLVIPVGTAGVTAGNTIIIGFASRGASTYNQPTITDSASNTYNLATYSVTYQHGRVYIYYAHVTNPLVSGNNITISTSSVASRVAVAGAFNGILDVSPLDQTLAYPTGTSTTAQGNSPSVGPTGTTVQADELLIGMIGTEEATDAGVGTWLNDFIAGPQVKTSGASYEWRVSLGYKVVSAIGQYIAAKTVTNNPYYAATIATFKASVPDTTPPTVTINQASAQADPTSASSINFTVVFSEPVSNFATGDVTLSGSAGATTATVTGSGTTYNVAVSGMTGSGTVTASLAAGIASDTASNPSMASTSTDNTVTYNFDNTPPTVTINQASAQTDPTSVSPINFTVVFSEPVNDFATGDVTLTGSANATTATVTGSGTTYNVAVSGMTGSGLVTASLAAGVAHDEAGNPSIAGTSTDNSVTYNYVAPTVVTRDGVVSSNSIASGTSLSIAHTVSAGNNKLVMVGVSWNPYTDTTPASISSVVFNYGSGSSLSMSQAYVKEGQSTTASNKRYSAIWYGFANFPTDQAGNVVITFNESVSNGIAAGAANFTGADPVHTFGTPNGATATTGTALTVTLTGLNGNELVFDNVFMGASSSSQNLTAGSGQTQLWQTAYVANAIGTASIKQATESSVTMSWTATSSAVWVIAAIPINPGASAPTCYALTLDHSGQGTNPTANPTNSAGCDSGKYVAGESINLSGAAANTGWQISGWTNTANDSSTAGTNSLSMPAGATTASVNYTQIEYNLDITSVNGTVSTNPNKATYHENDTVELTAVPATGYSFSSWSGGATGTTSPVSITIHGNTSVTAAFTQNEYNLTITSVNGTVTKNPEKTTYHEGDNVQLTAAPAEGYSFSSWSDGAIGTTNPVSITIHGNAAVTANFIPIEYTLIVISDHGTATRSPNQSTYHLNDVVTLGMSNVQPGWTFTGWDPVLTENKVTITGNITITAIFTQNEYHLNVTSIHGPVTKSPDQTTYHNGDVVTISVAPETGWIFTSWSGAYTGTDNPADVTINGDMDIAANYDARPPDCYHLSISHTGNGTNPTATPQKSDICTSTGQYLAGASITLSGAVADTGWNIGSWTGTALDASTASSNSLTMPADDHIAKVNYTQIEYNLTVTSAHGPVTKSPDKATYHYGEVVTLSVQTDPGWTLSGWNPSLTDNKVTINGDMTIAATFTQDEYTLAVISPHASVAKNPDKGTYHYGESVTLTMGTVDPGYTFTSWSGGATGTANPVSISIQGNTVVTANFTPIEYTLIVISNHGTPTRSPNQTTYHLNDVVTLGMTDVQPGWTFTGWDPALTANQITITGNNTVTAIFTPVTYTISGNAGVAGVTLSYTDGSDKTATSGTGGTYSFAVSYNWSGSVTPSLSGYTFSPLSKTYTNVTADKPGENYTATPITYTISGNAGISGVTLSYSDGTAKTVTAGSGGAYTLTVSYNWSGTVTPSFSGYTFNPVSRIYTNVLTNQITQDYTAIANPTPITFTGKELLGRPTKNSISISVLPDANISLYYEYGTSTGVYTAQTSTVTATGGQPKVVEISGLTANTKYYYRMQYSPNGGSGWIARPEYSFWTQRNSSSTFTFTITSDSHVNVGGLGNGTEWTKTLNNVAADHPDFEIDLGDTFGMDSVTNVSGAETVYKNQYQYFNLVSASSPIYLSPGNHEQQEAWHLDDTGDIATSLPVIGTNAQNKFFLNPIPNSFYGGNTDTSTSALDGDHYKEDYYSWTWGDALFVVIDPFWYTTTKPFTGNTGGGENHDTGSGDRWDWTLGLQQFNWLKTTLSNSHASYKFIFAHHMVGGSDDYVRGGANPANLDEWGGYNDSDNGATWGWDTHRDVSQWGSEPVRQILIDNQVSAFFHGHDHQYGYEKRDGIVYQALPAAGFTGNGFNIYTTGNGYTIKALPSDGHLRVTVGPAQTTVDYVQSTGASVAYSYNITPAGPTHQLTTAVDPVGSGTTNPAVGDHTYTEGSAVDVTATAATGYVFDHWSGACSGNGACSITMDADKTVTANFTAITTYTISGNAGVTGATLSYTDGSAKTATAGSGGAYSLTVSSGWGGTVTPSLAGYTFSPVNKNYTNVTANKTGEDYIATAITYTISGSAGVTGAILSYTDGTTKTVTAGSGGAYTLTVSYNWSGSVTPGLTGYTFTPTNKTYTNVLDNQTAQDYTAAVTPSEITFTGKELLGRPTNNSMSISVVPDADISLYYQYATTSGGPYTNTATVSASAGQPKVVVLSGLAANTKYYYRMQYSSNGGTTWVARSEYSFQTARAAGSTYSFTITSDGHVNIMLGNATTWGNTLNDVAADHADFEIDLGDTVAMDSVSVGDVTAAETAYKNELPYFNRVSANSPVFLVAGNHEQQEGWHLLSPLGSSLPVLGTNAQKKYFLDPVPDSFYSGDTNSYSYLDGDHLRQDYYAWTWGDALYVVIDPYWFSTTKPYVTDPGGGESDTTGSGDSWDWTLGLEQFNWLKSTLQNSNAKYKFVFAHQMVGGGNISGQADYGHGGANYANLVEWGGYNEDGTTWGWDTKRAGWGSQPIHQMMVANGVSAFFHGHDHQYGYEKLDGIVYQSIPAGGFSGSGFSIYSTGSGNTIKAINSPGHLLVTVGPSQTTVDYIQTNTTTSAYTYTILPSVTTSYTLTTAVDPAAGGTITPGVGAHTYTAGSGVDVTATAASGYVFDHWSGACTGSGACHVTMDGNKTVTANFVVTSPTCYTLSLSHAGQGSDPTASPLKSASCSTNGQYVSGATINLSGAVPTTGWQITGWTGTLNNNATTSTNSLTMPAGNQSASVTYTQIEYTLTITSDHGTVNKSPNKSTYHDGDTVQLTAAGASGWNFANWSGGATGTANPVTVTIHGNISITANYSVASQTHSITVAPGWNLVSFYIHPADTGIATVLSSIAGNYDLVYGWKASDGTWMKYDPTAGYGNTLNNLDETMGFWVHMTTGDTLEISGTIPASSNISLSANVNGWNLVGYPDVTSLALPGALNDHGVGTNYSLVYAYHANDAADTWKLFDRQAVSYSNDLTTMNPGWGYWIKATANSTWNLTN